MFNKQQTPQRINAGFILAIAFLLVLGSNRLNKRHFHTLQSTVNSVYKDRVLVQDYIYQLNNIFQTKKLRFITEDDFTPVANENEKVEKILLDFASTELTTDEFNTLNELNLQFEKLKKSENKVLHSKENLRNGVAILSEQIFQKIDENLDVLARIQIQESEQMTQLSNKSLETNILLSKLELAFLIVIGIALLALIFYPMKTKQPVLE